MSKRTLKTILFIIVAVLIASVLLCCWGARTEEGWAKNPDISTWFPDLRDDNQDNQDKPEEKHEHTFDNTNWKSDSVIHWHAATCGHNVASNSAPHTYNDGVCTVCGYEQSAEVHVHTYDLEHWVQGATQHWHAGTCGHDVKDSMSVHTYKDGVCTVCGYNQAVGEHVHTYDKTKWVKDEQNHWHAATCAHNAKDSLGAHILKDGTCTVCDYHEHIYNTEKWSNDGQNHWHSATCGHSVIKDLAAHTLKDGACTVCGYQQTEVHEHTWDLENWQTDINGHCHATTCEHNFIIDFAFHTYKNGVCTVCGYEQNHVHTYDTEKWVGNKTSHWHPATCGHEAGSGVEGHKFEDGVCTVCGYFE